MVTTKDKRDELVLNNQRLVHKILQKYCRISYKNDNYEDFFQQGIVGLLKAIDGFDPDKGFQFSTYAGSMIYGEVQKYKRECCTPYGIVIPRPLKERIFKAIAQDEDITSWDMYEHGAYLIIKNNVSSLDFTIGSDDGDGNLLHDIIPDNTSFSTIEEHEIDESLDLFLESIKEHPHYDMIEEILYDRLFAGDKGDSVQRKIAKKYGLSQSYVSRILAQVEKDLKAFLNRR